MYATMPSLALAFEALLTALGERPACRAMVEILALAHEQACEAELALELQRFSTTGFFPISKALIERFRPKAADWSVVVVDESQSSDYANSHRPSPSKSEKTSAFE